MFKYHCLTIRLFFVITSFVSCQVQPNGRGHVVPYNKKHPFHHHRNMQTTLSSSDGMFEPIRIHVVTEGIDQLLRSSSINEEIKFQLSWFLNASLPDAITVWTQSLSVIPISSNLILSTSELDSFQYCGSMIVPEEHTIDGVSDTDFVLYVNATTDNNDNYFCNVDKGNNMVGVACNYDQFDRPIAGTLHICLNNMEKLLNRFDDEIQRIVKSWTYDSMHSIGHILGYSVDHFRFFWDYQTGQPRTSRPFYSQTFTCVDGEERTTFLPDENTLIFRQDSSSGQLSTVVVTPTVQTVARNQFDCQVLDGAQLENNIFADSSSSCTGEHWDSRYYYGELMTNNDDGYGSILTDRYLSPLTLALFEDSGWYKANWTNSRINPFGHGAGCDFVNSSCLNTNASVEVPDHSVGYFCNSTAQRGCSSDHTHKAACTILDYDLITGIDPQPEQYYQYFNETKKGGPSATDFCPIYGSVYDGNRPEHQDCRLSENAPTLNVFSEVYGSDSACITSNSGEGLCYRIGCIRDERMVAINVIGQWLKCEYDFQALEVFVGQGLIKQTLHCPRLSQVCPDLFCPYNCRGRGICNFNSTTMNGTVTAAKCECFDANDSTPSCYKSTILEQKMTTFVPSTSTTVTPAPSASTSRFPNTNIPNNNSTSNNELNLGTVDPTIRSPEPSFSTSFPSLSPIEKPVVSRLPSSISFTNPTIFPTLLDTPVSTGGPTTTVDPSSLSDDIASDVPSGSPVVSVSDFPSTAPMQVPSSLSPVQTTTVATTEPLFTSLASKHASSVALQIMIIVGTLSLFT